MLIQLSPPGQHSLQTYNYQCILRFYFTHLKTPTLSGYKQALSLLKERDRAILLDIGCCCEFNAFSHHLFLFLIALLVGTDVRKAVVDGWPIQDIVASDIQKGIQTFIHFQKCYPIYIFVRFLGIWPSTVQIYT